jgi:hypothetical protein
MRIQPLHSQNPLSTDARRLDRRQPETVGLRGRMFMSPLAGPCLLATREAWAGQGAKKRRKASVALCCSRVWASDRYSAPVEPGLLGFSGGRIIAQSGRCFMIHSRKKCRRFGSALFSRDNWSPAIEKGPSLSCRKNRTREDNAARATNSLSPTDSQGAGA